MYNCITRFVDLQGCTTASINSIVLWGSPRGVLNENEVKIKKKNRKVNEYHFNENKSFNLLMTYDTKMQTKCLKIKNKDIKIYGRRAGRL